MALPPSPPSPPRAIGLNATQPHSAAQILFMRTYGTLPPSAPPPPSTSSVAASAKDDSARSRALASLRAHGRVATRPAGLPPLQLPLPLQTLQTQLQQSVAQQQQLQLQPRRPPQAVPFREPSAAAFGASVGSATSLSASASFGLSLASVRSTTLALRPPRPPARPFVRLKCSLNVGGRCRHALATRQCFGCRKFDPLGTGFVCEACWAARHPWFRDGHDFVLLQQRPKTPPPRVVEHEVAEQVQVDTRRLLAQTQAAAQSLGAPNAGSSRATRMQQAAGACDSLLERMAGMILRLRDDEWARREEAAKSIQRMARRRAGRNFARRVVRLRWGKVLDPATSLFYYVSRADRTKTTWAPPVVFGRAVAVADLPARLAFEIAPAVAATMVQGMVRRRRVRRTIQGLAMETFRRSVDTTSGRVYYYNMRSRTAGWHKPRSLGGLEPPFYSVYEDDRAVTAAARIVQGLFRRRRARRVFMALIAGTYEKVWDPASGRHFYFNKRTGDSRWTRPFRLMLGEAADGVDIPLVVENEGEEAEAEVAADEGGPEREEDVSTAAAAAVAAGSSMQTAASNVTADPSASRRKQHAAHTQPSTMSSLRATVLLASFLRSWLARRLLADRLGTVWSRVFDSEYGAYFYFNNVSGESTWVKPRLLKKLGLELPVTVDDEDEGAAAVAVGAGAVGAGAGSGGSRSKVATPSSDDAAMRFVTAAREDTLGSEAGDLGARALADREATAASMATAASNASNADVLGPLMREREALMGAGAGGRGRAGSGAGSGPGHARASSLLAGRIVLGEEDEQLLPPLPGRSGARRSSRQSGSTGTGAGTGAGAVLTAAGGGSGAVSLLRGGARSAAGSASRAASVASDEREHAPVHAAPSGPRPRPLSAASGASSALASTHTARGGVGLGVVAGANVGASAGVGASVDTRVTSGSRRGGAATASVTSSSVGGASGTIGAASSTASRTLGPADALRMHWRRLQSLAAHSREQRGMYSEAELLRRFKKLGTHVWGALEAKFGAAVVGRFSVGLPYLEAPFVFPGPGWVPDVVKGKAGGSKPAEGGAGPAAGEADFFFAAQLTGRSDGELSAHSDGAVARAL